MATVELEISGCIAQITLNRPDKLNAIDASMLDAIERGLDEAEQNDDVRVVLLNGNGRAFSAGFDMNAPQPGDEDEQSRIERIRRELQRDFDVIMRFWDCPKPTVAAVHGYCLGSAMEMTAVCDVTVAADDCRFGAPEVRYGNGIVCLILPWIIGLKNAKELLLSGSTDIDAPRALSIGLVNRVVGSGSLQQAARETALQIAANDSLALRLTKQAINRSFELAGMRQALQEALEFDVRIETTETPESSAFNAIMEKEGLKAAISWRAAQVAARNDNEEQR
jgi:enoyl-CoA hydratase